MNFQNLSTQPLVLWEQAVMVRVRRTNNVTSHSFLETFLEEGAQGTTNHSLLCACSPEMSIVWFMTSSHEAQNVSDHLRPPGGLPTPRALSLHELADAPFKVYVCVQKRGDLVVLPPRRYLPVSMINQSTYPPKPVTTNNGSKGPARVCCGLE